MTLNTSVELNSNPDGGPQIETGRICYCLLNEGVLH